MKVDIFQGKVSAFTRIAEIYMFKSNLAISDFFHCIRFVLHLRNFIKHLCDTVCGSPCDHDHDKYKSHHIQRHQNLNRIYDHTCQFSSLHGSKYNASSTDQRDQKYNRVHHELQDRRIPCNDFFCFCKQGIYIIGHTVKFVYLVIFSYECLYHT